MFKYYISVPFHCFTQYYEIYKKVLRILIVISDKLSIFLCALYKKGGVGDPARMQEFSRVFSCPEPVCSALSGAIGSFRFW